MTDLFVPSEVVAERFERLRVVVERSALARHRARVGMREEILVEGPSKRDRTLWTGRTRQNKLVHFSPRTAEASHDGYVRGSCAGVPVVEDPAPQQPVSAGAFAEVVVTSAAPHHLFGELVSVAPPRPARKTLRVLAV